ncbi:hypothetical protein DOS84_05375 [Flavobacterium aquariorum]|uniref:NERD domain-containing protein n=1 Tax=Flavobacterium aquariorum TaxID=2217670 RepID=A0A2W7UM49_9FLAO|nr:nuclease-related domain-containing protein [Flavobacterium aquariorum]PZX94445.1 hypothetical protein DOS84_05375 [Flavobacterium aquariorum]
MCKVFNTIGCLNYIQYHLNNHNIDEFNSINELINFQRDYHFTQQQIISNHTRLIEQEKITLEKDIVQLNDTISTKIIELQERLKERLNNLDQQTKNLPLTHSKIIPTLIDYYKNLIICIKILFAHLTFYSKLFIELRPKRLLSEKQDRSKYIHLNFQDAVKQSGLSELQELKRKKGIIENLNSSIYGAIGEHKVEKVLKKLSEDYILINDFTCSFQPPIYNRKENDIIKSVQIDHLLISPSGIFIIETKNWSEHSIANLDLRSPVQQVKRTNFALFKLLAGEIAMSNFNFKKHHWGDRKIPIRNIVVFINNSPIEEFQFVKILSLTKLLPYIEYFTPSFTLNETQIIADYLLNISDKREQSSLIV